MNSSKRELVMWLTASKKECVDACADIILRWKDEIPSNPSTNEGMRLWLEANIDAVMESVFSKQLAQAREITESHGFKPVVNEICDTLKSVGVAGGNGAAQVIKFERDKQ